MNKFSKNIAVLALGLMSSEVFSVGLVNNFYVDRIRIDNDGKGYVRFTKELQGHDGEPAACAGNHPSHLAFDSNTAGGKAILSIVMTAQASSKKISARGTGACSIYTGVEDWHWGVIIND